MNRLLDASVLAGPIPMAITIAGLAAAAGLLAHRGRHWWRRVVPITIAVAAVGTAAVGWIVNGWWRPFPDPLPLRVLGWIGVALFGVGLAAASWARPHASGRRRLLALLLLAVLLTLPAMKINAFYGYYPTLRGVLGIRAANEIALADVPPAVPLAPPTGSLEQAWQPPPDLPAAGRVAKVDIPGTVSGFVARPGSVYFPPAYLSSQSRPRLPVLVLIAGQPGFPQDWLTAGKLAQVMDRFAAAHRGLAPIVVMPDATGSVLGNPLCLDSRLGNAETYLARDVPTWITTTLQVDPDPRHRAIAGFSYGGTCALQLAVRQPSVYPTFLDISGQAEPSLGTRAQTVAAAFGGDEAAFRAANPLDILATATFPASTGIIAVGRDDPIYGPQARTVLAATRHAGFAVQLLEVPGGHTWPAATTALDTALPGLARRLGLL